MVYQVPVGPPLRCWRPNKKKKDLAKTSRLWVRDWVQVRETTMLMKIVAWKPIDTNDSKIVFFRFCFSYQLLLEFSVIGCVRQYSVSMAKQALDFAAYINILKSGYNPLICGDLPKRTVTHSVLKGKANAG